MSGPIPLIDVRAHQTRIGDQIRANINAVVDHGKWIMGPEVADFERSTEAFVGVDGVHALGCSNGTDALVLAMQALGVERGQAVICPAFTFVATAEAIAVLQAVPVFADVELDGFNVDPNAVRDAAKVAKDQGLTIAGICAVDLFGAPADYDALTTVAEELDCWLLSDAAQGFGGSYRGTKVGAVTDVTTTSFFPAKPLGCYGDGGMVLTTRPEIAEAVRSLRVHGKGTDKYDNVAIGQNSRLDTLQAAILLPKLAIFSDELDARDHVAARYAEGLADVVTVPTIRDDDRSAWAQYTIITDRRDVVQRALNDAQIGNAVYYPKPLHQQTGYAHFHLPAIDLERTEWLTTRVLSLPMYPYLSSDAVDRVIATVRGALAQ